MAGFTEAEKQYIQLYNSVRATLPYDLYFSIKHNDITDRKSLMRSLFFFMSSVYSKQHAFLAITDSILPSSLIFRGFNGYTVVKNYQSKKLEDNDAMIDELFERMMQYLPGFDLNMAPDTSFLKERENQARLAQFLRHLEINRELLLQGPPYAEDQGIVPEKAAAWVAAQKTPRRQELAQILLDNIRYIPHSELLRAIEDCVEKTKQSLQPGPIIFVIGRPKKSNYYICLLFAHFWKAKGYPIDCVIESFTDIQSFPLTGNFLDIDDMSYSGSQTKSVLGSNFLSYILKLRDTMKQRLATNKAYEETYMYLPRYLFERSLLSTHFNYFVVRAFMSERSFSQLNKEDTSSPRFPIRIITHELIPYMPSVDERTKKQLEYLFNDEVYTTVYFDHKVADMPSTYLLPIALGIVPEKMLILSQDPYDLNTSLVNGVEGEGIEYMPFIKHCDASERFLPIKNRNKGIFTHFPHLQDKYRCPFAWYKMINYDRGVYPDLPLPHGPTEENFAGGKRSKKRKTRNHKRQSKRKTRSTSK